MAEKNFNTLRKQWSVNWDLQRNKQNSKYAVTNVIAIVTNVIPIVTNVIPIFTNVIIIFTNVIAIDEQIYYSDLLPPPWMSAFLELQDSHLHHWWHLVVFSYDIYVAIGAPVTRHFIQYTGDT